MEILIGLPAYNEEKNIAALIVKIKNLGFKVLVCDDASIDSTADIARSLGAIVVKHNRNLGYGGSIQSLFSKAREVNADILVTFDADGQHRPEDIGKLVQPILDQEADLVIGSRFLEKTSDIPKYREIGIKALTKLANISTNLKLTDSQSGLRAYSKKAIQSIFPSEDSMGVSTEILIKADQAGLKIVEVPVIVLYEGETSTQNPTIHGMNVATATIKQISIKHPLMFYGFPGLGFLALGLFFTVLTLSNFAESRTILTNQALLAVGSIIVGLVLIVTAIILFTIISVVREDR